MRDLRELTAADLNGVAGGCRTVDTRFVDLIKAPIGPAFSDNSTGNPGRPAATNLTHVPLT